MDLVLLWFFELWWWSSLKIHMHMCRNERKKILNFFFGNIGPLRPGAKIYINYMIINFELRVIEH